jgi:hypothetical protein
VENNKCFKIMIILEHKMVDGVLDGKVIMVMIIGRMN